MAAQTITCGCRVRAVERRERVTARGTTDRVRVTQTGGGGGGVPYEGPYDVTSARGEDVTLPTAGKVMRADITVNRIPSNYGLVLWNGAVLTVS